MIQQGDVLFRQVGQVPSGARKVQSHILVAGEHTGHNHVADSSMQVMEYDDALYVVVGEPSPVVHPEHGEVILDPGVWQIGRVREYDHFERAERAVRYVWD